MRAGSREHGSHVAMLTPRTPLHFGQPSRVQRYSSSMHRAMEEDSLMTRYDDDDWAKFPFIGTHKNRMQQYADSDLYLSPFIIYFLQYL